MVLKKCYSCGRRNVPLGASVCPHCGDHPDPGQGSQRQAAQEHNASSSLPWLKAELAVGVDSIKQIDHDHCFHLVTCPCEDSAREYLHSLSFTRYRAGQFQFPPHIAGREIITQTWTVIVIGGRMSALEIAEVLKQARDRGFEVMSRAYGAASEPAFLKARRMVGIVPNRGVTNDEVAEVIRHYSLHVGETTSGASQQQASSSKRRWWEFWK